MTRTLKIMIVAGEASGDAHAAKLVNELRLAEPDARFEFFGATRDHMRKAGVETIVNADDFAIVGVPEIAAALPMFLGAFRRLKNAAAERKPDAVILVDFPEFNLKLAKSLKKQGLTVVYYISPQIWAWRKYRARTIRKYVDLLVTILPFEKDWYSKRGIQNVEYVGSPLAAEVRAEMSRSDFCRAYGLDEAGPIVSLLPGSRHKEVARVFPEMLRATSLITSERPETQFVIAAASEARKMEIDKAVAAAARQGIKLPARMVTVTDRTYDALNASDAAAVTSGTATLEAGLIGTPLVVVYKGSALNYRLLRPLISVPHFGLINLIAEDRVAKEMIQEDLTPEALAEEILHLLEPSENRRFRQRLRSAADKLGSGGASKRAALAVLRLLR